MDFATALEIEGWTLWSIAITLVACRMTSRLIMLRSIKKLQIDDYIMLFTVLTYTGAVVSTMQVSVNGSNYLPDGAAALLTPDEVASAVYGSKMNLVLEEFTLFTTWQVKACLLIMYSRLTFGLRENQVVKLVGLYCALGFVITQVLYLGVWCRPIQQYWAVPVHDAQCMTYINHMITATVFNVSSDLMIIIIPIPLLLKLQLPLKRKLILFCVFGLGIFVILAAVLNRYYNFAYPFSPVYLNWYVGELSTAVFVSNIPLCWPLLRRLFRAGTFNDHGSGGSIAKYPQQGSGVDYNTKNTMQSSTAQRLPSSDERMTCFRESEETINRKEDWTMEMESRRHNATVQVSRDEELTDQETDFGITKTIQVTQYTV